jgi:O-antigen/teichoic acid export membrane protein
VQQLYYFLAGPVLFSMLNRLKKELREGRTLLQFGFLKSLGMIAPLLIARFFSEGLFGSYLLAKMIVFFFATLLITSAQTPFIVYANQERAETGKINKSFSVQCVFLLFSIAAFLLISSVFSKAVTTFAQISGVELIFVCAGFIGIAVNTFVCNLFMALGERIKNALVELTFGGSTLVFIVLFVLTGNINIKTAFLTYLMAAFVVLVVFAGFTDRTVLLPFDFDRKHFKRMFDYTKWVMFGATAVYFINWVDNIILRAFGISLADIGEYGLGYQVFKGIVMLTFILNGYFLPFISEHIHNQVKIKDYLYNKRIKIFLLGLGLVVVLFVTAPYIFGFIYKDSYKSSVDVFGILLFGNIIILYNTFYLPILNALKKYKFAQASNVVHIVVKVLLSVALIPTFGLKGAAVATVVSYLFKGIIYEVYFRLRLKGLLGL